MIWSNLLIEPIPFLLDPVDVTTSWSLDSLLFIEIVGNVISYKGDGCMLCVLVFCYTIPLNYH